MVKIGKSKWLLKELIVEYTICSKFKTFEGSPRRCPIELQFFTGCFLFSGTYEYTYIKVARIALGNFPKVKILLLPLPNTVKRDIKINILLSCVRNYRKWLMSFYKSRKAHT